MDSREVLPKCHLEVLECMPHPVVVAMSRGQIVTVNRAASQLLGFTEKELKDQTLDVLFTQPGNRFQYYKTKEIMRRKDDSQFSVVITSTKALLEQTVVFLLSFRDLTRQVKDEARVLEDNVFAKMITNNTNDIFLSCTHDFRIAVICAQVKEILGYDPQIFEQKTFGELVQLIFEPDRPLFEAAYRKLTNDQPDHVIPDERGHFTLCVVEFTARFCAKSGEIFPFELIITYKHKTTTNYQRKYYIGAFRKITERIRTQKEELTRSIEEVRAKRSGAQKFCSFMVQMLKMPIAKLSHIASVSSAQEKPSEQAVVMQNISSCTKQIMHVADDLAILLNPQNESVQRSVESISIRQEKFSLRQYVSLCIDQCKQEAKDKQIELVLQIEDKFPDLLLGDSMRLYQILTNLVRNAIKFSPRASSVLLQVGLIMIEGKKMSAQFQVVDKGIGISKEDQLRLFQPFMQLQQGIIEHTVGSGLGLSICKFFAEKMGGTIRVESVPGQGATFILTLPFVLP